MKNLVVSTRNAGKLREFQAYLAPLGYNVLPLPQDLLLPVEDGETLDDNACIKAQYSVKMTGLTSLADDSGLYVKALGDAPGIYSARYAGEFASDEENRAKLLKELNLMDLHERTAEFRCSLCFYVAGEIGPVVYARGVTKGHISFEEKGSMGFGYDSLFIPNEGDGRTFAQMTLDEKALYSHRARALNELVAILSNVS